MDPASRQPWHPNLLSSRKTRAPDQGRPWTSKPDLSAMAAGLEIRIGEAFSSHGRRCKSEYQAKRKQKVLHWRSPSTSASRASRNSSASGTRRYWCSAVGKASSVRIMPAAVIAAPQPSICKLERGCHDAPPIVQGPLLLVTPRAGL